MANITKIEQRKAEIVRAFSTSPVECVKSLWANVNSIKSAIEPEHPIQLSEWKRLSVNSLRSAIIILIERALVHAGFDTKTMNNDQIVMVVDDIIEKYPHFRMEDVVMCFKKARREARYPQFYGRIDCKVFLSWFEIYEKERNEIIYSHPSNHAPSVDLSNGVPWEDYEAEMKQRMEAGDEKAKEQYEAMLHVKQLFERNAGVYSNYQYNRKHRFDDKK